MSQFLEAVVGKLPLALQPYAKAIVPSVLGALLVLQDLTVSVTEVNDLQALGGAALLSLLVLVFPNLGYSSTPQQ